MRKRDIQKEKMNMIINDIITKIVLLRLPDKIYGVWLPKPKGILNIDQEIYLQPGEKKIAEKCFNIFTHKKVNENGAYDFLNLLVGIFKLYPTGIIKKEFEQYYFGENSIVAWLTDNNYLKIYSTKEDCNKDRRNSEDCNVLLFEVEENVYLIQNVKTLYDKTLIFLISELIQDLRIEANLMSKQLNISKSRHLEIVYLKELRMNHIANFI